MLRPWLMAAALALLVPVGSWILISASESKLETDFRNALEAEFGPVPAEVADSVTVAALCAEAETAAVLADGCNDTRILAALRMAALASLVLSSALLVIAAGITVLTKGNRDRMAASFRPGLLGTLAGLAVLILVQAILVVGTLYEFQAAYLGYIFPWLLWVIAAALAVGVLGVLRAMVSMVRRRPLEVSAIALDRETDVALFEEVDAIAAEVGTSIPDVILAGLDPTFFVVEGEVAALDGRHRGRVLFLSVPLCRLLSRDELRAVVGHELGHFRGEDTRYSRAIAPAMSAGREALASLWASTRHWTGWAMIPAATLVGAFFATLTAGVSEVGRTRELEADRAGADAASAEALGRALVKLQATAPAWGDTFAAAVRTVGVGRELDNVAEEYAARARAIALDSDSGEGRIPHPFDTHPPLAVRLHALGLNAGAVAIEGDDLAPVDPASELVGEVEDLEVELSERLEEQLRGRLGVTGRAASIDVSASLRAAAADDPGVAAVVSLIGESRGRDMTRPFRPGDRWVAIADLLLSPHPDPHAFIPFVPLDALPAGAQLLVVGLAALGSAGPEVVSRGTKLRVVGTNDWAQRGAGLEEDFLIEEDDSVEGSRLIVVRGVGPVPLQHQIAGLLIVPADDRLAAPSGPDRKRVSDAVTLLRRSRRSAREATPPRDAG